MPGGYGGLLSFEVEGGLEAAERIVKALQLAKRSASFGAPSTLVVHPAAMWAGMVSADQLAETGLTPGLVRLGVGFERPELLIADLDGAFAFSGSGHAQQNHV